MKIKSTSRFTSSRFDARKRSQLRNSLSVWDFDGIGSSSRSCIEYNASCKENTLTKKLIKIKYRILKKNKWILCKSNKQKIISIPCAEGQNKMLWEQSFWLLKNIYLWTLDGSRVQPMLQLIQMPKELLEELIKHLLLQGILRLKMKPETHCTISCSSIRITMWPYIYISE